MSRKKFLCIDCRIDTSRIGEFYFINTPLWIRAVGSNKGMLCINCLEKRIGRTLCKKDFTNCFLNDPKRNSMSLRLLERLNA